MGCAAGKESNVTNSPEEAKGASEEPKQVESAPADAPADAADGTEKKTASREPNMGDKTHSMQKHKSANKGGMLNALALQFGNISNSFKSVHSAFAEFHTGEGIKSRIPCDKLKTVLENIGGERKEFTDDEVKELFKVSDLGADKELGFREFLICIAMGYFLKVQSDQEEFRKIQKGFKVVEKAFNDMDTDNGGSIDTKELKEALFSTANNDDLSVLEARFAELDFNGDGDIELPEFLYGMVSWVGFADEMDEAQEAKEEEA